MVQSIDLIKDEFSPLEHSCIMPPTLGMTDDVLAFCIDTFIVIKPHHSHIHSS